MKSLRILTLLAPLGALLAQTPAPSAPAKPKTTAAPKPAATPSKTLAPANGAVAPAAPEPFTAPPSSGKVVLTIGDEKITDREFDSFLETVPEQMKRQAMGPMKRQVGEQIVRVKLLAQEARRKGLDQDPAFKAKAQFQQDNMLAAQMFNNMQAMVSPDEASLRKSYEEHKKEGEEATARHILIRFKGSPVPLRDKQKDLTEEEALAKAQEIRKRLTGGEEFAKLAKEESDDTGSAAKGGDLGPVKHGQMVGPFDEAVFSLPLKEVSQPVKTQFGYHLIFVESRTEKSFADMKTDLESRAKPEAARQALEDLRKKANVVMDPAYFGPEAKN